MRFPRLTYLRRNLLPIVVGLAAVIVAVVAVAVVVDRVRDDEPERFVRIGPLRLNLDELEDAFEDFEREGLDFDRFDLDGFDLDGLGDLEGLRDLLPLLLQLLRSVDVGELLSDGLQELRTGSGAVLGVTVADEDGAVVVQRVQRGTPADRAGVEAGDEIERVDGHRVRSVEELTEALADLESGDEYELTVRRDGERITLDVEGEAFVARDIGELLHGLFLEPFERSEGSAAPAPEVRPEPQPDRRFVQPVEPAAAQLGVNAVDVPGGVRVAQVVPGSGAEQAGLRPGDVIVRIENSPVQSVEVLRELLRRFAPGDVVTLTIQRDGATEILRARLSPAERVQGAPFQSPFESAPVPGFPVPGLMPGDIDPGTAVLERLADLVAERLAARGFAAAPVPAAPPEATTPEGATPEAAEPEAAAPDSEPDAAPDTADLGVYFGRVVAVDDDSIRLTGTLGPVTLTLTADTVLIGGAVEVGDLVTAVVLGRVVQTLIVIG